MAAGNYKKGGAGCHKEGQICTGKGDICSPLLSVRSLTFDVPDRFLIKEKETLTDIFNVGYICKPNLGHGWADIKKEIFSEGHDISDSRMIVLFV